MQSSDPRDIQQPSHSKSTTQQDDSAGSSPSPSASTSMGSQNVDMRVSTRAQKRACTPDEEPRQLQQLDRVQDKRFQLHNDLQRIINKGKAGQIANPKDLTWHKSRQNDFYLELTGRINGMTMHQQRAHVTTQRASIGKIIDKILNYKFINTNPCTTEHPEANSVSSDQIVSKQGPIQGDLTFTCLTMDCDKCYDTIGKAMQEVGALIDYYSKAMDLYPSPSRMKEEYPQVGTKEFEERIDALCSWYYSVKDLYMGMLGMYRFVEERKAQSQRQNEQQPPRDPNSNSEPTVVLRSEFFSQEGTVPNGITKQNEGDDRKYEILNENTSLGINLEEYYNPDTLASFRNSELGDDWKKPFNMRSLAEVTYKHLRDKRNIDIYREYYRQRAKIEGVKNSMIYIYNHRQQMLDKVYYTFEKPNTSYPEPYLEGNAKIFSDCKDDKGNDDFKSRLDEEIIIDGRRCGLWSPACRAMCLPAYNSVFMFLSSVCIEAVNEYQCSRLGNMKQPSYLTVLQLKDELRESVEICALLRSNYWRHLQVVMGCQPPTSRAAQLTELIKTFDVTIEIMLNKYLSYITTTAESDMVTISWFKTEWAFIARLAKHIKCAVNLAPPTFTDITCYQLEKLLDGFMLTHGTPTVTPEIETIVPRNAINSLYQRVREALVRYRYTTLETVQWGKMLCIRLARAPPPAFSELRDQILNCTLDIRDCIQQHVFDLMLRCNPDSLDLKPEWKEFIASNVRILLIDIHQFGFELHKEIHRMVNFSGSQPEVLAPPARRPRLLEAEETQDGDENNHGDEDLQGSEEFTTNYGGSEIKEWDPRVAHVVTQFATCWMMFVINMSEKGKGIKALWVSQGLQFLLQLVCDPRNTKHLSEKDFTELKSNLEECVSHLVGTSPTPLPALFPAVLSAPVPDLHTKSSPEPNTEPQASGSSDQAQTLRDWAGNEIAPYTAAERRKRVLAAIQDLDKKLEIRSRHYPPRIGRVKDAPQFVPRLPHVTFKWVRGLLIGGGTFGEVYTVVNTDTDKLLAMKEVSIRAENRTALEDAVQELRILEGINHSHLVKCFGCEVHRDKMRLFMELCMEGSLATFIVKTRPLPEPVIRDYTSQLVSAIQKLHSYGIVHRDIKSANIFLAKKGHCLKLGDFGTAIRIRAYYTVPGELKETTGTYAYMAPEVIDPKDGYGRAADIWSLGCVVTEMASGYPPFNEFQGHQQIIVFVAYKNGRPDIPSRLSPEGQEFCDLCLTHQPNNRPNINELLQHHFVQVPKREYLPEDEED